MRTGKPVPKVIQEAPELLPGLTLYWRCYFDLRRGLERHLSVPWRDVELWCATYGVDRDATLAAHEAVLELDLVWATLQPKPPTQPEPPSNGPRTRNKRN